MSKISDFSAVVQQFKNDVVRLETEHKERVEIYKKELDGIASVRKQIDALEKVGVPPGPTDFKNLEDKISKLNDSNLEILNRCFKEFQGGCETFGVQFILGELTKESEIKLGKAFKISCNKQRQLVDIGPFRVSLLKGIKNAEVSFGKYTLLKSPGSVESISNFIVAVNELLLTNQRQGNEIERDLDEAVRVTLARSVRLSNKNEVPIQSTFLEMTDIIRRRQKKLVGQNLAKKHRLEDSASKHLFEEIYSKAQFSIELKNYIHWSASQQNPKFRYGAAVLDKTDDHDAVVWLPPSFEVPGECRAIQTLKII